MVYSCSVWVGNSIGLCYNLLAIWSFTRRPQQEDGKEIELTDDVEKGIMMILSAIFSEAQCTSSNWIW